MKEIVGLVLWLAILALAFIAPTVLVVGFFGGVFLIVLAACAGEAMKL